MASVENLKTKQQVAGLLGINTRHLAVLIKRGKLICSGDSIDIQQTDNKAYISKQQNSNKKGAKAVKLDEVKVPKQIPRTETYIEPDTEDDEDESDPDKIPDYHVSETKLKFLDTKKREREIALLKIKEDKIRGTVIPSELVKPVFLQHNQSIITAMKNMMDEKLREIAKKHSLNVNEVADIKGNWVTGLNESIDKATKASIKAVDNIISEHSEKKSVGERG